MNNKHLTTEQLKLLLQNYERFLYAIRTDSPVKDVVAAAALTNLIVAECREHGYAGYEDAVKHLIEDKP